ncbi:hypothetical protein [Gordonia araii]|nr:hypothetical protein [Gordonia araii]NNG98405.1 hypothetical protein [Gordonia araii NBRC 100433]
MPTALKRIQVTQTPTVAESLAVAEREWPGVPRAELIVRLMARGAEALEASGEARRSARRRLLRQTQGTVPYPHRYLEELREDWPE